MSTYIELTPENIKEVTSSGIVLIDFWAPWCGPCRMLSPVIDELAQEYDGKAKICKVNTDEYQDLTVEYAVRSVPTILFMKNGKVVDQLIGANSKQAFADKLDALI